MHGATFRYVRASGPRHRTSTPGMAKTMTKTMKSLLLLMVAALTATLVTSPSSALPAIGYSGSQTGTFYTLPGSGYAVNDEIQLVGNFSGSAAGDNVTFFVETSQGSNNYTDRGSDVANSSGNAYLKNFTVAQDARAFGKLPNGDVTELGTLDPIAPGECTQTGTFYTIPSIVGMNEVGQLVGNFPGDQSGRTVTFYKKDGGTNQQLGTDVANSGGNAYLKNHNFGTTAQTLFAEVTSTNECTGTETVTPQETGATLGDFETAGSYGQAARVEAAFVPADSGASASLQVKRIGNGDWDTIETASQNSSGVASFYISNPLEVEHDYRAVSNGILTNVKKYAGPMLSKNSGVATVHFNSNDGESVNTRSKYFEGELSIKGGPLTPDCGNVAPFEAEMKGRGNYSWSFDKKSFSLKFGDKMDLCGMGSSKKWALVANHYDRSLLRNTVANEVGDIFDNLKYTPNDTPVDLYVNGSYRGSYILIERINFEGGRLDFPELKAQDTPGMCSGADPDVGTTADVNGSYLLEWDFRKGGEDLNFGAGGRGWVALKEPEEEDYCQNMGAFINDYVDLADRDLFDGSPAYNDWMSRIDLATAVDYYLAMEFLKPVDGQMWTSVYMYKPRGGKLEMGPLWDFDLGLGSADRAGNVVSPTGWYLRNPINVSAKQTEVTWFNKLNENPTFRAAAKQRWNEVDSQLYALDSYVSAKANVIEDSADWNYRKWNHDSKISQYQVIRSNWNADVSYLRNWVANRASWMNSQLDNGD